MKSDSKAVMRAGIFGYCFETNDCMFYKDKHGLQYAFIVFSVIAIMSAIASVIFKALELRSEEFKIASFAVDFFTTIAVLVQSILSVKIRKLLKSFRFLSFQGSYHDMDTHFYIFSILIWIIAAYYIISSIGHLAFHLGVVKARVKGLPTNQNPFQNTNPFAPTYYP
ncbi:hypothetical protein RF11_07316 [Thelohanellus kitauei]|uniref:MARVEL domain-containing protein n=1 Tax=Thelohanellus kitauei TaxID=669202 RepID=A0A0C2IQG1_THEKT|nr:hypothetical protein RF11_07316 [Thelohanellus kitauei]